MANTSASGGYLVPAASPNPIQGEGLEDFMHAVLAGISGLAVTLIRPAWQPEPPNIPNLEQWLAFRIASQVPDTYAVEQHSPTGDGSSTLIRHEVFSLVVSAYGRYARELLAKIVDGFQIAQNREVLFLNGMGLVETGDLIPAPSLYKEKWMYRVDTTIRIRRQILRSYPVLNLLSAQATLNAEIVEDSIIATNQ